MGDRAGACQDADGRLALRRFLNKECMWRQHPASSSHVKIFLATTAISPSFRPGLRGRERRGEEPVQVHFMNVTIIFLKPKNKPAYATVYLNNTLLDCVTPEIVHQTSVPGRHGLFLLFFGDLFDAPPDARVPAHPSLSAAPVPDPSLSLSKTDLWLTSSRVDPDMLNDWADSEFNAVGKVAWYARGSLFIYFLSVDYMVYCPQIPHLPSIGAFLNLLTRCDRGGCVPCFGRGIHVDVTHGHTLPGAEGNSCSCPCVASCATLRDTDAPVRENRSLLGLLFDAEDATAVESLRVHATPRPRNLNEIIAGLTADGSIIIPNANPWVLLRVSHFYSRMLMYNCQVLKRSCLHFC
nr:tegument protein UL16 [Eptesicus fuscus gammaherpesvirus]